MDLVKRFLGYAAVDTQSDENSESVPSTAKQKNLAVLLKNELEQMGLEDVSMDDMGYVYATLPANTDRKVPAIGFISHIDTSPSMSGLNVKPRIVERYDGGDIVLNREQNIVLSPELFPELLNHKGEDLIVTDGTTLLGADDKAGIAEIVTAVEYLQAHPEIKHGKVRVGFNPDEEIGMGAAHFDVAKFGCEFGYTVDGGEVGEMEFENFNAAKAVFKIQGLEVHPGYAKGKMVNASLLAAELINMFPADETPGTTCGYEGFYHIVGLSGEVDNATVTFIIRDHDRRKFEARKAFAIQVADRMNGKYGKGTVSAAVTDQYYNMKEQIDKVPYVVDIACEAMRMAGVEPVKVPIRGGTDGAQLSFKGLPCPNLFAGGMNFHGRYEWIPIQSMEKAMMTVVRIVELCAKRDWE
ncbi:MAG: peptidase T [Bacteroidaceae bacterium]|nr:peptidase T [Bacteroidaceae bacterium]